jgi:hypothetical protein
MAKRIKKNPKRSRSKYYLYGYEQGQFAAQVQDPEEILQYHIEDRIGEMIGEILENYAQYADTPYYYMTSSQLDKWEEGFTDGFFDEAEKIAKQIQGD